MLKKVIPFTVLFFSIMFLSGCIVVAKTTPRVDRDDDGPPVVVVYEVDPVLVVIPGTYVYWLDANGADVFFYGGAWWRPWRKHWYRAEIYTGRWVVVDMRYVPASVKNLPHDWKKKHKDGHRVHWNETKRQWNRWEKDRRWDKKR